MADDLLDHDSAFGDDDFFWVSDPMFSTPVIAGTKREAGGSVAVSEPKHPDVCCEACPEVRGRPHKRRASAERVSAYHKFTAGSHEHPIDSDCQFPDDCFEKFCQECNLDVPCPPDCSLPVPCAADVECSTPEDACWDPHCDPKDKGCADGCVDPKCTKLSCPEQPCFCQKCDAPPCPLGDPDNECHYAHTGPTTTGTIYCYDNAPCHFQEGLHGQHDGLASFETYPCFSNTHGGYMNVGDGATQASSAQTPALSHSNFTSLDSIFSGELSPGPSHFPNCFLGISGDHCHIDDSCCHGQKRACGDISSATPHELDLWNSSMARSNSLTNNFMNFGLASHPTSPVSTDPSPFSNSLEQSMLGFNNDNSWMFDPTLSGAYQPDILSGNKLYILTAAAQQDIFQPTSALRNTASTAEAADGQQHVCRWYVRLISLTVVLAIKLVPDLLRNFSALLHTDHDRQHAPGALCLATFPNPSALHAHTKATHVDNCASCYCHWESCDACSKDFKQRSKLSRHLLGHCGHRPYACSFPSCTKTFATNQAKDNHERTHTGERPYVCDRCGYTTTTHTQLQTHISALHEGKKPHKCRFCDFTCADSSNLSKHERTHQTLRPYRCPHAGCTFKPDCRWENLKRHLRRSSHCPELLEEASEEYTSYREGVRREIEEWHRRNGDVGAGKGRRKGRG